MDAWKEDNDAKRKKVHMFCKTLEHDYNKSLFQRELYVICSNSKYNSLDVVNGIALEYILRFSLIQ